MTCLKCGGNTEQDGLWPVVIDGEIVMCCYGCFERESWEIYWAALNAGVPWPEPTGPVPQME